MTWFFPQSGGVVTLANGDDVFVAPQVFINDQIYGPGAGHQVIVAGTVALYGAPVVLVGNVTGANSVTIESTGQVRGFTATGVGLQGTSQVLVNHGFIKSMDGDFTGYEGVFFSSSSSTSSTGSRFTNTGTVEADSNGVKHYQSAETLHVDNSGVIKGGVTSFTSDGPSRDLITNKGIMIGNIELGNGDDLYNGRVGNLMGDVLGGAGKDVLYGGSESNRLYGGSDDDTLLGNAGNDTLKGDAGVDRLLGGIGNDKLYGGIGIDTLTGNAGNDYFVFDTALNRANSDVITDFTNTAGNNDAIWLENAVMTKLAAGLLLPANFRVGAAALDANDFIVYNKATGILSYDSNGSAAGAMVQLATLTNKPTLTAADFLVI